MYLFIYFFCEVDQTLQKVAQSACEVSVFGDTQNWNKRALATCAGFFVSFAFQKNGRSVKASL